VGVPHRRDLPRRRDLTEAINTTETAVDLDVSQADFVPAAAEYGRRKADHVRRVARGRRTGVGARAGGNQSYRLTAIRPKRSY
jgi:hypothetical protein